ncbi:hypothetical protein DV589_25060 [Salmonella enterica]|nr:hypothetical protein [Salmonella enterica]
MLCLLLLLLVLFTDMLGIKQKKTSWLEKHKFQTTYDNIKIFNFMFYAAKRELLATNRDLLERGMLDDYFELRKNYWLFD